MGVAGKFACLTGLSCRGTGSQPVIANDSLGRAVPVENHIVIADLRQSRVRVVSNLNRRRAGMKYGVATHFTEYSMRVDALAKAAEERGFESLFVPEHTHIPVERRTPFPLGG